MIVMIGIYKITNLSTGKYYIGQSGRLEERIGSHKRESFYNQHKDRNSELYNDIRKFGIDNFSFEILETIDITHLEEKWIQKCLEEDPNIYNKDIFPFSDPGYCRRMFSEEQVDAIKDLMRSGKHSNMSIAKIFDCSPSTIDNIDNGKMYASTDEKYPLNEYKRHTGQNNHNAVYSDEEVIEIRKQYVNKTLKSLYESSDKRMVYKAFERLVCGGTYKHLPVYIKREKRWIQNKSCID